MFVGNTGSLAVWVRPYSAETAETALREGWWTLRDRGVALGLAGRLRRDPSGRETYNIGGKVYM